MRSDRERLLDMLDALDRVTRHADLGRDAFDRDEVLQSAVLRWLEVLGEAAGRLTPAVRDNHPEIAWPAIVAFRNRLAHGYFDVDVDLVWAAVEQAPMLWGRLAAILEEVP